MSIEERRPFTKRGPKWQTLLSRSHFTVILKNQLFLSSNSVFKVQWLLDCKTKAVVDILKSKPNPNNLFQLSWITQRSCHLWPFPSRFPNFQQTVNKSHVIVLKDGFQLEWCCPDSEERKKCYVNVEKWDKSTIFILETLLPSQKCENKFCCCKGGDSSVLGNETQ